MVSLVFSHRVVMAKPSFSSLSRPLFLWDITMQTPTDSNCLLTLPSLRRSLADPSKRLFWSRPARLFFLLWRPTSRSL